MDRPDPTEMSLPAVVTEIGELQGMMGDRQSLYWRDERYQSRLRTLYEARDGKDLVDAGSIDLGEYMTELAPVSLKEFAEVDRSMSYLDYIRACGQAADVVLAVPEVEREDLIASFNWLPDDVGEAVGLELVNRTGTGLGHCSDEDVARFAGYPGGRVIREWSNEAPVLMARVRARLNRAMDSMTIVGEERFLNWLESLSDGQAAAVYRKLAA